MKDCISDQGTPKYRILSLEGGGFRGVLSAILLKEVEKSIIDSKKGESLRDYFHLVAGTSTGSLLAAGIALGMSSDELLKLYEEDGKRIFPDDIRKRRAPMLGSRWIGHYRQAIKPLYPLYPTERGYDEGLFNVLKKHLSIPKCPSQKYLSCKKLDPSSLAEGITLKEIEEISLLIPAYNTKERFLEWFSNYEDVDNPYFTYKNIPLWKLCACSSAAPTYFEPIQIIASQDCKNVYIDGGVAANNPVLLAISKAMRINPDLKMQDIAVLSIGTGKEVYQLEHETIKKWGTLDWASRLGSFFLPAPNKVTNEVCWQLIRGDKEEEVKKNRDRFLSLNVDIRLNKRKVESRINSLIVPNDEASLREFQNLAKTLLVSGWEKWSPNKFGNHNFWNKQRKRLKEGLSKKGFDEELSEIDNPELFTAFSNIAMDYLEEGAVHQDLPDKNLWKDFKTPKQAIANFICSN